MTPCPFTSRELECVHWLSQGKTASEIATIIGRKRFSIQGYIKSAREKIEAATVASLVATSIREGWMQ